MTFPDPKLRLYSFVLSNGSPPVLDDPYSSMHLFIGTKVWSYHPFQAPQLKSPPTSPGYPLSSSTRGPPTSSTLPWTFYPTLQCQSPQGKHGPESLGEVDWIWSHPEAWAHRSGLGFRPDVHLGSCLFRYHTRRDPRRV